MSNIGKFQCLMQRHLYTIYHNVHQENLETNTFNLDLVEKFWGTSTEMNNDKTNFGINVRRLANLQLLDCSHLSQTSFLQPVGMLKVS